MGIGCKRLSGKVDVFFDDNLNDEIDKYVSHEHGGVDVYFPFMYSPVEDGRDNPAVTDPTSINISTGLDWDDPPVYRTSIDDLVTDWISGLCMGGDINNKIVEPDDIRQTKQVAARLREHAKRLDEACA